MRKRTLIAVLIALVLTYAGTAMWSAATIERDGDTDANVIEDSGSEAGRSEPGKGSKVVHALAAPFKVFGHLFHKDGKKLARMTAKDAEKFETVGVTRVEDPEVIAGRKVIDGSAREHLAAGRTYL